MLLFTQAVSEGLCPVQKIPFYISFGLSMHFVENSSSKWARVFQATEVAENG